MKKSTFIHGVSVVTGLWGGLALIGAWLAPQDGTIFGFSELHCYYNAIILILISISAGVCAIYRQELEKR